MGLIRTGKWAIAWGQAANVKNRYTKNGKEYTTFAVAYDFDKEENKAVYLGCTAWNKLSSEYVSRFEKGDMVVVMGVLTKSDYWTEKNGKDTEQMTVDLPIAQMYFDDYNDQQNGSGYDTADDVSDDELLNSIF